MEKKNSDTPSRFGNQPASSQKSPRLRPGHFVFQQPLNTTCPLAQQSQKKYTASGTRTVSLAACRLRYLKLTYQPSAGRSRDAVFAAACLSVCRYLSRRPLVHESLKVRRSCGRSFLAAWLFLLYGCEAC